MADHISGCAATNLLLCTETHSNLLCLDDDLDDQTHQAVNLNLHSSNGRSEPLVDFIPCQSEEGLCLMLEREKELMPKDDYLSRLRSGDLDLSVRREALDWIWKAHAHYSFGALSACLSINFVDRFLSVYELPVGDPKFVFEGIDFLEFKPSEIAAAVAISVSGELQAMDIDTAVSCFIHVGKERVVKCHELVQNLALGSRPTNVAGSSVPPPVPQSPVGVLDAACFSYKSDERTVGSCPNSSHSSPDSKRRKLDRPPQGDSKS
ncbi:hypothetical protein RJ639_024458 [Escallonia herrerae]|uniref:Cyclin N-terminal domain-containing protein n=1 Tax=Escallonia herrerae TaxID=1293975 RepID=A0AA88V2E2_9ASTE|nr:hypothetical protein RJ639_024458 [Escallonia herrerae]